MKVFTEKFLDGSTPSQIVDKLYDFVSEKKEKLKWWQRVLIGNFLEEIFAALSDLRERIRKDSSL